VVRPAFAGNEAFLLNLLRARPAAGRALDDVRAERRNGRLEIRFTEEGRATTIDWDLAGRTVAPRLAEASRGRLPWIATFDDAPFTWRHASSR
jgi:YD repeat-containing protein